MAMLVSRSLIWPGVKPVMPILLAVHLAVAGMTCIRPDAPTPERASMMKRLSWRIRPYTYAGSSPISRARRTTLSRKGMGKRWSMSITDLVRSLVLMQRSHTSFWQA